MPTRQITHESEDLKVIFRERLGADVFDASTIHGVLVDHIAKEIKLKDKTKLPRRYWGRVIFVTNIIQQTVSVDGTSRFDIPGPDAPDEDITDFYEFAMALPERIINFFQEGLNRFDAVPLVTGAPNETSSVSVPELDSSLEAVR